LLVSREWKMAVLWCGLFGLAMALVLATKIAFVGWGIGIESVDFTGISGHATRAAMVYPVLFYYAFQRAPRKFTGPGIYVGVLLGLLISVSRVMVNAHSGSEIVAGQLLGSAMAAIYLGSMKNHVVLTSRRWLLAFSMSLLFVSPAVKPVPTERAVTKLALLISGHKRPFTRDNWGHSSEQMHFWSFDPLHRPAHNPTDN
jgi:hypothetical protein